LLLNFKKIKFWNLQQIQNVFESLQLFSALTQILFFVFTHFHLLIYTKQIYQFNIPKIPKNNLLTFIRNLKKMENF